MKIDGQLVDKNFIPFHAILNEVIENYKEKHLIFEHIYISEIFTELNEYCKDQLLLGEKSYIMLNYQQIIEMLPKNWKLLKYLNKNKNVYIISANKFTNQCDLNLTQTEIEDINNHLQKDKGTFAGNFENDKINGIIVINDLEPIGEFKSTLTHELIHFFQWNTGKTIKEFFNEQNFDIKLTDKDLTDISILLNLEKTDIYDLFKRTLTPDELEVYTHDTYYDIKKFCYNKKLRFSKLIFSMFIESFEQYEDTFLKYYNEVINQLIEYHIKDYENSSTFKYLIILGYMKQGFNSFKNYIYSYFNKEQQKGKENEK